MKNLGIRDQVQDFVLTIGHTKQLSEKEGINNTKRQTKASKKRFFRGVFVMFSYKTVAFLPNVCYNNKVNKNEKGVEEATPTPPIKTKQHFA